LIGEILIESKKKVEKTGVTQQRMQQC